MSRIRPIWRFLYRGKSLLAQEAGASLFQGLRIRLTLWYCGVLGAALVLFGVALYLLAQYFLLLPIKNDTQWHAHAHTQAWLSNQVDHACPFPNTSGQAGAPYGQDGPPTAQGTNMPEMVICFDQNGDLLQGESISGLPSAFLSNNVALAALQAGQSAEDIVNVGGTTGQVYRYAYVVPDPLVSGREDVIVTGESIQTQQSELSLLLVLLLSVGSVTLLGAGLGGLFLANRALVPARLAWGNQQRFIADAAHELRTPLTLMRADAEVLLRGRKHLPSEDAALLEDIVAEANHMSNLATNLLTLARLDNRSSRHEYEVVNLVDIAREGMRRVQALAEQTGITLHLEATDPVYIIGDPTLLQQATLILLDNAIKYNRHGGSVTISTAAQKEQAQLIVRDTGVGIASEHLSHLGERFYRVDKARSREAGGTGLGLSIAHNIAHVHSGSLTLASTPGEGTTVTITLPLVHEELPEDDGNE